jgi:undecaprenyl-diphosphatase
MRPGVFVVVFGVLIVLLSALIVGLILSPWLDHVDSNVSAFVRSLRTPGLTRLAVAVTDLGNGVSMFVMVSAAAVVLVLLHRRAEAVFVAVTVLSGWLLGSLIQVLVHRARPQDVNLIPLPRQYSFPSGHSLATILFFGALSFIVLGEVRRPWLRYGLVALFALLAIAVGVSRVYLGVHWAGDVLGAWLLGGAVLLVAVLGYFAFTPPYED